MKISEKDPKTGDELFYIVAVGGKMEKCNGIQVLTCVMGMLPLVNVDTGDSMVVIELTEEEFVNGDCEQIMLDFYGESEW